MHRLVASIALAAVCAGCASDGSSSSARPNWFSSWFGRKPQASKTYEQYLAEQQQRSIVAPGMGLEPKAEPGPLKRMGNAIASSSLVKGVKGVFKGSAEPAAAAGPSSDALARDPISLSHKSGPPKPEFYVSVARLEERAGNVAAAREHYQKALDMDPEHQGARLGMARFCDRQGELAEATRHYVAAVKRYPNDASALNDLGLCYARQDLFQESAATLEKAVALQPDRVLYRNNLATVLVELNRIDDALSHLEVVHGKAVAHYNLGFLLNNRGQKREALEQFERAVAADPKFEAARSWADALAAEVPARSKRATLAEGTRPQVVPALAPASRGETAPEPASSSGPVLELAPPPSSRTRAREDAGTQRPRDVLVSERPAGEILHLPSVESAPRRR